RIAPQQATNAPTKETSRDVGRQTNGTASTATDSTSASRLRAAPPLASMEAAASIATAARSAFTERPSYHEPRSGPYIIAPLPRRFRFSQNLASSYVPSPPERCIHRRAMDRRTIGLFLLARENEYQRLHPASSAAVAS